MLAPSINRRIGEPLERGVDSIAAGRGEPLTFLNLVGHSRRPKSLGGLSGPTHHDIGER